VFDWMLMGVTDGDGWNLVDGCCRIIRGLPSMLLCGDKLEFPDDLEEGNVFVTRHFQCASVSTFLIYERTRVTRLGDFAQWVIFW
jgi:hypothetical protein